MRHILLSSLGLALLLGVRSLAAQQPGGPRLSAHERGKAEALLAEKLPCLGCHTLQGRGGRIGPDLSAVGARLDAARIRRQIEAPQQNTRGGIMPRIPLPAPTLELIMKYLAEQRTAVALAPAAPPPRASEPASAEARLYQKHCSACHGATGRADGWNAQYLDRPPARHADARAMGARTDDRLFDGIYAGGYYLNGSARMPPFGQLLSRAEIRSLVRYIRTLCSCRQPAWADAPK